MRLGKTVDHHHRYERDPHEQRPHDGLAYRSADGVIATSSLAIEHSSKSDGQDQLSVERSSVVAFAARWG